MLNLIQSFTGKSNLSQLSELDLDNLQHLHFHLHCKDRQGKYIECNDHLVRDAGFSNKSDLLGMTDFDLAFLPEQEAATFRKNDSEIITSE